MDRFCYHAKLVDKLVNLNKNFRQYSWENADSMNVKLNYLLVINTLASWHNLPVW